MYRYGRIPSRYTAQHRAGTPLQPRALITCLIRVDEVMELGFIIFHRHFLPSPSESFTDAPVRYNTQLVYKSFFRLVVERRIEPITSRRDPLSPFLSAPSAGRRSTLRKFPSMESFSKVRRDSEREGPSSPSRRTRKKSLTRQKLFFFKKCSAHFCIITFDSRWHWKSVDCNSNHRFNEFIKNNRAFFNFPTTDELNFQ